MAFVCKITDYVTEIDLYYSAAAGFSLLDEGFKPSRPESRTLYGGLNETRVIQHLDGKRRIPLNLHLGGSSDDDMLNRINELQRLVKQSRDFHLMGWGDEVFLEFKLSAATNTSRFPVLSGEDMNIDRIMSMFVKDAELVDSISLVLVCKPYWESTTLYTLENYLRVPHFEEDGNSDGLADHWAELGTPTTTLDTTIRILTQDGKDLGTQSQKVVTDDAGDDGIYSAVVSDTETSGVGYAWVYAPSGDEVAVELYDATAPAVKDTALYSEAGWETKEGADGNTWKRLVVSSDSLTSENDHCLRIIRRTGDASAITTFYVDQCYLELGTSTVPVGWMSGRWVSNCYDYIGTTRRVNFIDFADMPGDVAAKCQILMKEIGGAAPPQILWIGMDSRQPYAVTLYKDYQGAADAGRSGGEYYTGAASSTTTDVPGELQLGGTTPQGKYRAFAAVYDTHDDPLCDWTVRWRAGAWDTVHDSEEKQCPVLGYWFLLDMGVVDFGHVVSSEYPAILAGVALRKHRSTGTEAVRADVLILIPVEDVYRIISVKDEYPTINSLFAVGSWYLVSDMLIDPPKDYAINFSGEALRYFTKILHAGSEIRLPPKKAFRLWFLVSSATGAAQQFLTGHDPTQSMNVSFKYRARGVHLQGAE